MTEKQEITNFETRAEQAYAAMYDAVPHNVKDHYEDASLNFSRAIGVAKKLGLTAEVERLSARLTHIENVYNHQFRYVGR